MPWISYGAPTDGDAADLVAYLRSLPPSAGRVPSDRGYRYYVDRLMHRRPLPAPHARPLREVGRFADLMAASRQPGRDPVRHAAG